MALNNVAKAKVQRVEWKEIAYNVKNDPTALYRMQGKT